MHEHRWLDRLLYEQGETQYISAIAENYHPKEASSFLEFVPARRRAEFIRTGIWYNFGDTELLPEQGWKIHVSLAWEHLSGLRKVIAFLLSRDASFKLLLDRSVYLLMNSKRASRSSSGKLITVYPKSTREFKELCDGLRAVTEGFRGPYVLSDNRVPRSHCIFYRYGQIKRRVLIDEMGFPVPVISDNEGRTIVDERAPGSAIPEWLEDPYSPEAEDTGFNEVPLELQKYNDLRALYFSNTGGVYRARVNSGGTNSNVVLKEARPFTHPIPAVGMYATDLLDREWSVLQKLSCYGIGPRPIRRFKAWEHVFIEEEFIQGDSLRDFMFKESPLVDPGYYDQSSMDQGRTSRRFLEKYRQVFGQIIDMVRVLHENEIYLGDLSATNLIISEGGKAHLIDLESTYFKKEEGASSLGLIPGLFTPGFASAEGGAHGDLYSLASLLAYVVYPVSSMSALIGPEAFGRVAHHLQALGWPVEFSTSLTEIAKGEVPLREVESILASLSVVDPPSQAKPLRANSHGGVRSLGELTDGLAKGIIDAYDANAQSLFPIDPFGIETNPLSLGFGAGGILWTLGRMPNVREGIQHMVHEYLRRAHECDIYSIAPGLMNGAAGMARILLSMGCHDDSVRFRNYSNERFDDLHGSLFYGKAGILLSNIQLANSSCRFEAGQLVNVVREQADSLLDCASRDDAGLLWETGLDGECLAGLGYGQSGVGLALYQAGRFLRESRFERAGADGVRAEVKRCSRDDGKRFSLIEEGTELPHWEVGAAGVLAAAARVGLVDEAVEISRTALTPFHSQSGLFFGSAGVTSAVNDLAIISGSSVRRDLWRDSFQKTVDIFGYEQDNSIAMFGEGLARCSCEVAGGSAGVLGVGLDLMGCSLNPLISGVTHEC